MKDSQHCRDDHERAGKAQDESRFASSGFGNKEDDRRKNDQTTTVHPDGDGFDGIGFWKIRQIPFSFSSPMLEVAPRPSRNGIDRSDSSGYVANGRESLPVCGAFFGFWVWLTMWRSLFCFGWAKRIQVNSWLAEVVSVRLTIAFV